MYKVFIVDDDPAIVSGVKQMVAWEEYGMDIPATALNGMEAREFIVKHGTDILITDIRMPLLDGLGLIRAIREDGLDTRFIVLSGYDDFEYLKECIKLGIENYLLKPVNEQELTATLINTLDKIQTGRAHRTDFSKDIHIIRNNILYRWVTGSIGEDELNERFFLLGVKPGSTCYTVCILRILEGRDPGMDSLSLIPEIEKICQGVVRRYDSGPVFPSPESDEIVFLFTGGPERNIGLFIPNLLEECRLAVKCSLNLPLFITNGGLENSRRLVHRSYQRAKELQQYSLIFPPDSILDPQVQEAVKVPIKPIISMDEITRLAASKDLETLLHRIDHGFNQIQGMEGITPTMVQNTATEVLIAVINGGMSTGGKNSLLLELGCPIADVYKMQSLQEIVRFTKETASRIIHHLIQRYERVNPVIKRVTTYIKANYSQDMSLKTLAADFNVNAHYLGRLFKEELGEFFSDYLHKIRVEKAKELLINTNQSIREISLLVGYTDPNYFYPLFKKYTGVSPAEYRNQ